MITLIDVVAVIGTAGALTVLAVLFLPKIKHEVKKREVVAGEQKPFARDWGRLPVVKRTGSAEEGRIVETRRIVIGKDRYETRLYLDGGVVESRRFEGLNGPGGAEFFHDKLVAKNGADPNAGAAPDWAPTTAKTMWDLSRERRMELALQENERQLTSGEQHAAGDVKDKPDPKAPREDDEL